ncbi:hypothetical protein L3X38_023364 [Prunus dulcis]|uniref:RING-type E3 ubiquitin transferase n=1 Tax=Prunus dulcis TaxID=3755 RepID=A0AAD4Z5H3_PRUDU|nr:hypothetical protein L3X38_023364 [Prunus dulcis]
MRASWKEWLRPLSHGYVPCLIEVNEIAVRVVVLLAFLFHQRLLQLKWYTQLHDHNLKASWVAEKKVFLACSPLSIAGGFVALFMNVKQNQLHIVKHFLWGRLRSYAGLVLDCFVFPQVLLNIFLNSKKVLFLGHFTLESLLCVCFHTHMTFTGKKPMILGHPSFRSILMQVSSPSLRTSLSVLYICYLLQSSACSSGLADDVSFQVDLGDMKIMRKF